MSKSTVHDLKIAPAIKLKDVNAATGLVAGSFGIGTYRTNGRTFPGLVQPDGATYDLSAHYPDTLAVFEDWDRALDLLADIAAKNSGTDLALRDLECLPPVARPNMLCTGSNYRQHVAEMMTYNKFNQDKRLPRESDESFFQRNLAEVDRRAREGMPFFWTGLHSALCGANDDVPLPLVGAHHDWELEFAAVVARTGRYIRPEDADQLIAGYVMVNDLGTVDEFRRADVRWGHDWVSKHQPNFKPAGPFIVPKQFVDRAKVQITMKLNGEVMQDWPISDMIFQPEQILSYASERIRLMPGDFLLTGSPPGNGAMHGGRWMKPGDVLEGEITYLGRQTNNIVAEQTDGVPTYGSFITEWSN
ncbi:fumarylacetoacetate hydrolase family protein [Novosphingobium profundi]|uniref:fumarylacetoacetate hydrolase family protein n=1 Tax=Novosphingobium profundi TaxID=1774954 RepID=UPI001CFE1240|nr:fumarylacetoacetate hydrolase family protein [Novosphingobium profundi]